jgi:hypothetical protein
MFNAVPFLLFFVICATLPVSAAGKRPPDTWNYYHFDGRVFTPGQSVDGGAFLALQEKMLPVIMTTQTMPSGMTALPDDSGAVAGICYTQNSGGKLGSGGGFRPHPRTTLLLSSGDKKSVPLQADDLGYFVAILSPGTYSVNSGPFNIEITVERGKTTLVPLRTGKRMVD